MRSTETGMEQQNLLEEPFFQEIMNELEEPVNEETLRKQQRKYRAMKNDLYTFYHEGKQSLLGQIREMSRLLEDRRQFRQMVIDKARKDPKNVAMEKKTMKMCLEEIDDLNQQIDLENEKQIVLEEEVELLRRQIWEFDKGFGGLDELEVSMRREGEVLSKRLATLQRMYNEKLGKITKHRDEILNLEMEHREYIEKAKTLEWELQITRSRIVDTLKAVKPILKKRSEFMTKTLNNRNKADKHRLSEQEELENEKRRMDYEAFLNKHVLEKKKPRQPESPRLAKQQNKDKESQELWDTILHVNYDEHKSFLTKSF